MLILGPTEIGDYSFIGANAQLGPNPIGIGRYSSIGPQALLGPNQHPLVRASTSAVFYSKSWQERVDLKRSLNQSAVAIGNDVWIGTRAIVLGGVAIGDGAVVAAGAIVTRNVAPYSIVAGVPAQQIGLRFDSDLVATLLESRWWSYELPELNQEAFLSDYYGQTLVSDVLRGSANQRKRN